MASDPPEHISFHEANHGIVCVADARCIFSNNVQHRLNVRRRAGNNTKDLTRGRCRTNASLNSEQANFSMAITAWSAKVSSSLICAGVKGRTSVRRATNAPITSSC